MSSSRKNERIQLPLDMFLGIKYHRNAAVATAPPQTLLGSLQHSSESDPGVASRRGRTGKRVEEGKAGKLKEE